MITFSRLFCSLLVTSAVALAQQSAPNPSKPAPDKPKPEHIMSPMVPNPAFDRIKALAGDWEGTAGREQVKANYKVMSNESTVVMLLPGEKPGDEMLTIFHPDNENLLVTHYCSARNQPRMRMVPTNDPNIIKFEFLDATNLPSPNAPHMVGLTLKLVDKDHHVQTWTFAMDGKTMTQDFDFRRKM